jgi:ABC-type amino acid transport system permease subunit
MSASPVFSTTASSTRIPAFFQSIWNTLMIVGGVLLITVVGGTLIALLIDQPIFGQGIVRILVISPFFVMPPVAALVWKNMIMHPGYGVLADINRLLGLQPVDWFAQYPLLSIIIIVAWQWLPFATLILLTALQSLDSEQKEAAEMDGANVLNRFIYLTLPHLARDYGRHPDPDDLPAGRLRGNPRHDQWRPGLCLHQPHLPDLPHRAVSAMTSAARRRAASSRSSSPTIVAIFLMRAVGRNLDR